MNTPTLEQYLVEFNMTKHSKVSLAVFNSAALTLLALTLFVISPSAMAIQKCKDSEGKWHYGDTAQQNCAESEVTTLSDRGFIKEVEAAPKTEAELKAEAILKEEKDKEDELARQEKEEKERILSIYEQESDIDRQRDNQLASVDGNIRVHKAYLKQMDAKILRLEGKSVESKGKRKELIENELAASKLRVEEFSTELKRLEIQREGIIERFAREKKLYKDITEG